MPNGNQSRSDDASRAEETRPEDDATSLGALAMHLAANEEIYSRADRQWSRRNHPAYRIAHDTSFKALCDTQYALLHVLPENDEADLMILAGFASMLGDQLPDLIAPDHVHGEKVCEGIKAALVGICATLARSRPAAVRNIDAIYPELARCIRQDVLLADTRRAEVEGQ